MANCAVTIVHGRLCCNKSTNRPFVRLQEEYNMAVCAVKGVQHGRL